MTTTASAQLGEYESLERVNLIAKGIVEHGPAFAAYVAHVGALSVDEQTGERFAQHFNGEWESTAAYAEHELQQRGIFELVDDVVAAHLPPDIRPYVTIDTLHYARDLETELYIVQRGEGGVWVFDTSE